MLAILSILLAKHSLISALWAPHAFNLGKMLAIGGVGQDDLFADRRCQNQSIIINCDRAARKHGADDVLDLKSGLQRRFRCHFVAQRFLGK